MPWYLLTFVFFTVFLTGASYAENGPEIPEVQAEIGIEERLGANIPLDLSFSDESGKEVQLRTLINKPTILSLTYYRCSNLCDNISANIAGLLGRLQSEPGKDYSVITVSFDERDTPADALHEKEEYRKMIGRPFPEEGWRFLTGNSENVRRLTNSVGFKYQKEGDGFRHPATLIVISSSGKIIRYLYGTTYLPFDVLMAFSEASTGRTGPTIPKALLLCYRYDPWSRRYVFNVMKVTGAVVLLLASSFFIYLLRAGRKNLQG